MRRNHVILAVTVVAIVGALVWRTQHADTRNDAPPVNAPEAARQGDPAAESPAALPRMVELGSDTCASCRAMIPVLEELREQHAGELEVVFIDVWKFPDEAKPFEVRIIPTQVFLAPDGAELARHEGFFAANAIRERWASLGFPLESQRE